MKPSERIHQIASRTAVDMGGGIKMHTVQPEHILEYLDEQEQSSHAAKGERHGGGRAACGDAFSGYVCKLDKGHPGKHRGENERFEASWPDGFPDVGSLVETGITKSPAPDADGGAPPLTQAMRARVERQTADRIEATRPAIAAQLRESADSRDAAAEWHDNYIADRIVADYFDALMENEQIAMRAAFEAARDAGRKESAEALGRAEAERDDAQRQYGVMCELHKSAMVAVELCTRERQDETARAEKAEARLAAWRTVVLWATTPDDQTTPGERAHQIEHWASQIPAEHRPNE